MAALLDDRLPRQRQPSRWHALAVCVATGLGIGWVPWAPGSVGGAVWGLPLAYLIGSASCPTQLLTVGILCAIGIPICTVASRALGDAKDPGTIVFDEITSLPITFLGVPMTSLGLVLTGFVLNRVLDIVKPPPARQLEHLPAGLGVMADDWVAGIGSCGALHLLIWLGVFARGGQL